ncbi:translation initiation factor 2 [Pseudomonas sp. RTC3]|uniref:translation initiation factor 2 n=1 Tax=Pseudomonas sp. 5C2 TaxID=3048588 RepID=UPI002AB42431|nr:translation initiation factor 2 [Pseudomonas sp. 5C2]MDY7563883.1 translation initiation factor 2 [Pseudomonas sp. 5C2]MEB0064872.1 translation initiation factor 2 [Pseudomonas sp. RTC3]MEB0240928.1 translation initiation factor 2 [Pseudomonas sp. 5C2]
MRSGPLCLLLTVLTLGVTAQADELSGTNNSAKLLLPSASSQVTELQQRLKESEHQREELSKQIQSVDTERESLQFSRLRVENQRLKLQLKEAQSVLPPRMFTDEQQWFVAGGGVAMIALLCGIFASGWRRQRRQWLN